MGTVIAFVWGLFASVILLKAGLEISDWQLWAVIFGGSIYAVATKEWG